jgi:hypothetical protein
MRRAFAILVVGAAVLLAACTEESVEPVADTACYLGSSDILAAQTVPGASYVPCVSDLDEFDLASSTYDSDRTRISFDATRRDGSWTVELVDSCDTGHAEPAEHPLPSGVDLFVDEDSGDRFRQTRYFVFDGGCVVSKIDLPTPRTQTAVADEAEESLHLVPRTAIADRVDELTDGELSLDPEP